MNEAKEKLSKLDFALVECKKRAGERLRQNREIFQRQIHIGDIHSHSTHSDGSCSVEELKTYADLAGMDFIFVTDHHTLNQKADCDSLENVWLGQEPVCSSHHIGLLLPETTFVPPKNSFREDWEAAVNLAPFVWVPHPTGWGPKTNYKKKSIEQLFNIGDSFAMEILNGVFKMDSVFDAWQLNNVKLWDELLVAGKHVTPIGASDAHFAPGIGCVWTGLFDTPCDKNSIIRSLSSGHTIASEAPLLLLLTENTYPGGSTKTNTGDKVKFKIHAADSLGLSKVRLIKNGKVIKLFELKGEKLFEDELVEKASPSNSYYRLECVSIDYKHAFTSPIYLEIE